MEWEKRVEVDMDGQKGRFDWAGSEDDADCHQLQGILAPATLIDTYLCQSFDLMDHERFVAKRDGRLGSRKGEGSQASSKASDEN